MYLGPFGKAPDLPGVQEPRRTVMNRVSEKFLAMQVLMSGCSLLEHDERVLSLETDREVYDLGTTEVINVEAENTSSGVIYFSTCMPTTHTTSRSTPPSLT